jgi:Uma2 family endonuclease
MSDTLTAPTPPAQAPPATEPITFAQFIARDDERKADLIDGYLLHDMPTDRHEDLFAFLLFLLRGYARERGLGEVRGSRTPVRITDRRASEPDLLFVRRERIHIIHPLYLSEAPDLAVEIVSPSSVKRDYEVKRADYEAIGVREYWLIDPEREVARFFRRGPDGLFTDASPSSGEAFASEVVTGFRLDPQTLFADPLPSEWALLSDLLG